jgi:crossover junction endodeoxyribonuclease RusA
MSRQLDMGGTAMPHTFIIPGRPVPKVRMTQKSKWSDQAKRSLLYQQYVAWCAKDAKIPVYDDDDIELTVKICLTNRGNADLDNYVKIITDGIQRAGVIKNDKQILRYGKGMGIYLGWKEEQVIVTIAKVEESEDVKHDHTR